WGADVLKVEMPERELLTQDEKSAAIHVHTNRNKRSIALDMKRPEGREIFHRLACNADVIIEGFRPGVMVRPGADYDTVRAFNHRIIYCSLSGFGQTGPYSKRPAHGAALPPCRASARMRH